MHPENCSTCSLASTATWQDFKNLVLRQYLLFRAAGGEAFIGFWIPHTDKLPDGHIEPICLGEFSVLLSVDDEESCLTIFKAEKQMACFYIPWEQPRNRKKSVDFPFGFATDQVRSDEWFAVKLAADLAISELSKFGVDPVDAFFTSPDWVMRYG
jgi:hypothetical protein